jgi:SM-20-related protein
MQARVASFQTYGPKGRFQLAERFLNWEAEALELARHASQQSAAWEAIKAERKLKQKSPFAQFLLSNCHRDVVLDAQQVAKERALLPSDCRRERFVGELPLEVWHVATLEAEDLVVVDGLLPADVIAQCCAEAESLDAAGHLAPPAMHRALGDRRDRLVGLDEGTELLPRASALGQLVSYLKSLAFELGELGYAEPLTVPSSVMLACYDGEGAFYKPHMDSATTDPRRLTAIVYLVPPDWDAQPDKDGGQLVWWRVADGGDELRSPNTRPQKNTTEPKSGRLVLFKSRTIMHEVLPTHRKRFALTLWYFEGRPNGAQPKFKQPAP